MEIVAKYNFNKGEEIIKERFSQEYKEIQETIQTIQADICKIKESKEKTMLGKMLYSPVCLNDCFKKELFSRGWINHKEPCEYKYGNFLPKYKQSKEIKNAFRDMDFVKNKIGIEVQFGKYSFMVYNVCAKMTIFKNFGIIDAGIEIVPVKNLADEMSTGVSYFEQIAWDLEHRGVSNIDTPVLILGIDA